MLDCLGIAWCKLHFCSLGWNCTRLLLFHFKDTLLPCTFH